MIVQLQGEAAVGGAAAPVQGRPGAVVAPAAPGTPAAPMEIPYPPLPAVPPGGMRLTVDDRGDQTVFTATEITPQYQQLAERAQETAFGLMGLFAIIVFVGPFVRMWARRLEKRAEMAPALNTTKALQEQIVQLQQSVDAVAVEIERVSEAQRFQARLLKEKEGVVR